MGPHFKISYFTQMLHGLYCTRESIINWKATTLFLREYGKKKKHIYHQCFSDRVRGTPIATTGYVG